MANETIERLTYAIQDLEAYRDGLEMAFLHGPADSIMSIIESLRMVKVALEKKKPERRKSIRLVVSKP